MEHTKGKWEVEDNGNGLIYITGPNFPTGDICDLYHRVGYDTGAIEPKIFTKVNAKANAQRIVACVNACENLSNNTLTVGTIKEMIELMKEFTKRVEDGEVRSKYTYGKMRTILRRIERGE